MMARRTSPLRVKMHAANMRMFKLAQQPTGLVVGDALLDRRAPLRDLARVENLKRARLYSHDREAYEVRVALLGDVVRRPMDEPVVTDVAKRRKYKGKPIARTLRY